MWATSGRLLQLLGLLQSRRDWTAVDLAERLEVTPRTIRRDVDRLRDVGYTIEATPGVGGGYRFGHGNGVPPLLLTSDEAVVIAAALRSTAVSGLAGIDESALQALLKIDQSLPLLLRRRLSTLQEAILPLASTGPVVDISVLLTVASAIRDRRRLHADYTDHHERSSVRSLEPHRIVRARDRWYLVGWDVDRTGWRTLRMDRLQPHPGHGQRFTFRNLSDAEINAMIADAITTRPYRYQLRMTAMAPLQVVEARISSTRGRVSALDDQTCSIVGGGNSLEGMARWIACLGFDVVVHEPPELLGKLDELAARLRRASAELRQAVHGAG